VVVEQGPRKPREGSQGILNIVVERRVPPKTQIDLRFNAGGVEMKETAAVSQKLAPGTDETAPTRGEV
jgi:hypothetical protein